MTKKKVLITSLLCVIFASILIVSIVLMKNDFFSNSDGSITVEVVKLDGSIQESKKIEFKNGDKLEQIIIDNFENTQFKDGMLMSILDYTTPSDWSTFLSVYVDNEMSLVGISQIEFKDKMVISLRITEFVYE